MRCHNCKTEDAFKPWKGTMKLRGVAFEARGDQCRECGEVTFDDVEVNRQERMVATEIVERGVRSGRDFQFVRKVAGLRANELAALIDVRPETVSRWESSDDPVPKYAAFVLGELFEHPKLARAKLELLAG